MTTEVTNERLADRLNYVVGNPSAWPEGFNDSVSELIREAVSALRALSPSAGGSREVVGYITRFGNFLTPSEMSDGYIKFAAPKALVTLASLEAVERERDAAWAARNENAKLKGQRDAAFATVAALSKQVGELKGALEPFAVIADGYDAAEDDAFEVWQDFDVLGASLPLRIFCAARRVLAGGEG